MNENYILKEACGKEQRELKIWIPSVISRETFTGTYFLDDLKIYVENSLGAKETEWLHVQDFTAGRLITYVSYFQPIDKTSC